MVKLTVAIPLAPWSAERVDNVEQHYWPALAPYVERFDVIEDQGRLGCWPTVRRAWQAAGGGTHHLVLSDDLQLCRGFGPALLRCIELRPADVLSLFTARPGARDAPRRGKHWCISWDGATGAANVLPTQAAGEFLAWERSHIDPACPHDDVRQVAWCLQGQPRRRTYTPVPCLVQHGHFPSVIAGPAEGMFHSVAPAFCEDGEAVDWTKGLRDPDRIGASVDRLATRIREERLLI